MNGAIRAGVGGWTFEPWRGVFYPAGLPHKQELAHAAQHLTSIEINGTYYRTQSPASFAKWRDETPEGFVFSVKAPRFATTRKVLAEAGESITRFFDSGVAELGDKLGPVNWQFMGFTKFDPEDFEAFLALLPKQAHGLPLRHVVEVRHESFACAAFVALARKYEVAVVLAADSEYPMIADVTAPFVYARLMGTTASEKAGYGKADLDRWAARAKTWAAGGVPDDLPLLAKSPKKAARDVFLYVISGEKVKNPAAAMALIERLSAAPR